MNLLACLLKIYEFGYSCVYGVFFFYDEKICVLWWEEWCCFHEQIYVLWCEEGVNLQLKKKTQKWYGLIENINGMLLSNYKWNFKEKDV